MSRFGLRSSSDGFKVSEEKTNAEKLCKSPKVSSKKTTSSSTITTTITNYQNNNNNNKRKKSHTQDDQVERDSSPSLEESRTSNSTDISSSVSLVCSLPLNRISGILKKLNLSNKNYNIKSKQHNEDAYMEERKSKANNECNDVEHEHKNKDNDKEKEKEKEKKTVEPNQNIQAPVIKILCLYCDKKFTSHEMQVKHVEKFHTQQKDRRCSGRNSQLQYESKRSTSSSLSNSSSTRTGTSSAPTTTASSSTSSTLSVTFASLPHFPGCWFCKKAKCERVCVPAKDLTGLFLHLSECHADKYFGCRSCLLRFQNIGKLSKHLQTVHRNNAADSAANGKSSKNSARPISTATVAPTPTIAIADTTTIGERVKVSKTRQQKSQKSNEWSRTSTCNTQEVTATGSSSNSLSPSTIIGADEPILSRLGLTQNRLPNNRKGVRLRRDSALPDALLKTEQTTPTSSSNTTAVNASKLRTGKTTKSTTVSNDVDGVFRMPTRTEVSCVFDDDFYKEVVSNVRKNLLYFLDGKMQDSKDEGEISAANLDFARQPPLPQIRSTLAQSPVIIEDSEIHAATCLSATTAFPTLLTAEQYGGDMATKLRRPHTKHSWKWKWDSVKKYKLINEGGKIVKKMKQPMLGLRDLSKLDMWTQLTMRQKHEMQQLRTANRRQRADKSSAMREEKLRLNDKLNQILDMRLLPNIILEQNEQAVIKFENDEFGVSAAHHNDEEDYGDLMLGQTFTDENFLSMLNLLPTTKPEATRNRLVLSGEWARPRCYMCMCCGAKFEKLKSLEEHKMFRHSHILSTHYEVVGRELLAGNLLRHLFLPMRALSRYQNKDSLLMSMCMSRHHKSEVPEVPALPPPLMRSNTNSTAEEESSDSLPSISNSCNTHTSSIKHSATDDCDTDTKTTIDINTVSPTHSMQSSSSGSSVLTPVHKTHLSKSKSLSSASPSPQSSLSLALPSSHATHCTKCKRKCSGLLDLYRHMLDCSGDYIWSLVKKRKYRYYCGTKKRRQCNKHNFAELRRNKPKRTSPPVNAVNDAEESGSNSSTKTKSPPRPPRPSDAESIKKMLENLPPKRVCKKIFPTVTKAKRAQKSKLAAKHKLYNKQVLRKTRARQMAAAKLLTKTKSQLSRKVSNNNNNNNNNNNSNNNNSNTNSNTTNSKKERSKPFQRKGKKIVNVALEKKSDSNSGTPKSANSSNEKPERAMKSNTNSTKLTPVDRCGKGKHQQQQREQKQPQADALPSGMDDKPETKDCKAEVKHNEEAPHSANTVPPILDVTFKASSVIATAIVAETKSATPSTPTEQKVPTSDSVTATVTVEARSICSSLRSSTNKTDQQKTSVSSSKLADSLVGGRKRSKRISDCIAMLTGKLEEKLKTEQCVTTSTTSAATTTTTTTTTTASAIATISTTTTTTTMTTTSIMHTVPPCPMKIVTTSREEDKPPLLEKVDQPADQPVAPQPIEKKTPKRKAISRRIIQPVFTEVAKTEQPVQETPQLPQLNIQKQVPKIVPLNPPTAALPPPTLAVIPVATTTKQPMPLSMPSGKLNQAPSPVVAMPPCPMPANAPVPALMSVPLKEVANIPPQSNLPLPVPMNVPVPVSVPSSVLPMPTPLPVPMPMPMPLPTNMLSSKLPLFIPVQTLAPGMGPPLPGIPIAIPVENVQPKVMSANVANLNAAPGPPQPPALAAPVAPAAPPQLNAPLPMAFIQSLPPQYNLEPLNLSNAKATKSSAGHEMTAPHRPGIPARRQTICGWEAANFLHFDEMEPLDLSKKSKPESNQMEPTDLSPLPLVVVSAAKPLNSAPSTGSTSHLILPHAQSQPQSQLSHPLAADALLNKQIYSNLELLKIPQVRNPTFVSPPTENVASGVPAKCATTKKRSNCKLNVVEPSNKGPLLATNTATLPKKEAITPKKESANKHRPILKMDEEVINHIDDAINSVINAVKASLSSSEDGEDDDCNNPVTDRATSIFNPLPANEVSSLVMFPQQLLPTPAPTPTTTPAPASALVPGVSPALAPAPAPASAPATSTVSTSVALQAPLAMVTQMPQIALPMPPLLAPAIASNEFPALKQREIMMPQRRNMRSKTLDCRPVTLCTPLVTNCFPEKLVSPICSPLKQTEVPKMPTMLKADSNATATLPTPQQEAPIVPASAEPPPPPLSNVAAKTEKLSLVQHQVAKEDVDKTASGASADKDSKYIAGKMSDHCNAKIDIEVAADTVGPPVATAPASKPGKSVQPLPLDAETEIENNNTSSAAHKIVTPTPSISHETNINSISEENISNINNTSSGFHSSNQADSVVGADPKKKQRRRRKNELAAIVADQLLESFKIDKARRDNLKKLENLAYEKSDDLLLTGMLLMSSTKRTAATNNNNTANATSSGIDKTSEKGAEGTKRARQENTRNARNKSKTAELAAKDEKRKSSPNDKLSAPKGSLEPVAALEAQNDNEQENTKKLPARRRSYRRRGKTMDNENIIKLKSSLESFSIGIEKQLSEIEARNMFNTESKTRAAGGATIANAGKPTPSILRPSILSASLEKPAVSSGGSKQQDNIVSESKAPVLLSSRDPRLNKNIHKLEKEAGSNSNGLSAKGRVRATDQTNLDEIGDLEEDNYLTEIAKNVNEKIMAAENEDFAFANDGFELANELQDDSNSKYYRPPTSMSVRSAPNFNDDHSNFGSICDDNTNTEVMDMDLDDELSVYTSYSQDLGRGRGRRRRRRRSILMKRRPKKRPTSRDLSGETFDCTLCKKTFFTANSLTKHNMTLAHVSKVSELEYLQSKSMQGAVSVLNETNLELLNAQNNRLNTPKPRATRSRSRCGSLPPPRITRRAATPSKVLAAPLTRQEAGKCSPPREVGQSKSVEPNKKLNNSMLQQQPQSQQQQHHHHHHQHLPQLQHQLEEHQKVQPAINLNPDERLFFECCSILKGAESTMRSSTATTGPAPDTSALIGPLPGTNVDSVCNNGANFTKAAVEQNLFKDPQIVTPTLHSQKIAMPSVPPAMGNERNMRSPNYSAISQFSAVTNTTTSRFKTKAAMKGYENVHVDLTIQQELESKSRTVCKLTELADIALGGDKPNSSSEYNTPNSDRRSGSTPKRLNTPECNVHLGHERPKTTETQSSTSSKTIMHSSIIKAATNESSGKIIIPERPFKNIGLEEKETIKFQKPKTTINLLNDDNNSVSSASYSDRDDFDFGSMSCDDDASIKTANEKSLIMGRIFKSANTKSKSAGKIKPSAPAEKEQTPLPVKTDLNQLFDELRAEVAGGCGGSFVMSKIKDADGSIPTRETPSAIIENLHNKYASMSPMPQLPPEIATSTPTAKSARSSKANKKKSSSGSAGNKKQQKKNVSKLQSELGVSREDLDRLVDESVAPTAGIYANVGSQGRRKPKRRCAANQQKKMVEMWSSDEYEEFLSTKDIIALIAEKEKQEQKRKRKNSGHQPLMPPAITITPTTTTNTVTTATTAPQPTIANPSNEVNPAQTQKMRAGKEKKRKNNNNNNTNTAIASNQKEDAPVVSRHKREHQAKPSKQSKHQLQQQEEMELLEVPPSKRKLNNNNTTTKNKKRKSQSGQSATRRKRPATEKLYYWSSSSDDEFGRVDKNDIDGATTSGVGVANSATAPPLSTVNATDVGGNFESGEQYQQHGWIVGGSHKKLVTLLAIAKGNKKVDNCGVKRKASKKKN